MKNGLTAGLLTMAFGWVGLSVLAPALLGSVAVAHETEAHKAEIEISRVWARTTGTRRVSAAAYLVIENNGHDALVITGVTSDIAGGASIHRSLEDARGVMIMESASRVTIAPGARFAFEPGGYHVMLQNLKAPLTEGHVFFLTLLIEGQKPVTVPVQITGMAGLDD